MDELRSKVAAVMLIILTMSLTAALDLMVNMEIGGGEIRDRRTARVKDD